MGMPSARASSIADQARKNGYCTCSRSQLSSSRRTFALSGFANGAFDARPDDGLAMSDCMVTNAVRCVPPQNKPTGAEIRACAPFLAGRWGSTALPVLGKPGTPLLFDVGVYLVVLGTVLTVTLSLLEADE